MSMAVQVSRRKISTGEYHRMIEAGILREDDRIELINGELLEMSPISSRHSAMVDKIKDWFILQLTGKAIVRAQNPILLDDLSEPEPDIAVVKYREDYYANEHPRPKDVWLIIEVSETSLEYDEEIKLPLYAEAGISNYWIVNLKSRKIKAYRDPSGKDYRIRELAKSGDHLPLDALELSVPVSTFL